MGWASKPAALLLAACALALPLVACSDDDVADDDIEEGFPVLEGDYEPNCGGYAQRLRDCGLVTEGSFNCEEPLDTVQDCRFECLTTASCSLLARFKCVGTPPALTRCLTRCEYFPCDDTYLIPLSFVCDHDPDCADGTDELDCSYFECGSGGLVSESDVCDVASDCADSSDEADCPKFSCGSGELIPEQWRCDFDRDCTDGSDEVDCPRFVCEINGEELPAEWKCDLEDDCLDGSDEFGCAQMLCF